MISSGLLKKAIFYPTKIEKLSDGPSNQEKKKKQTGGGRDIKT